MCVCLSPNTHTHTHRPSDRAVSPFCSKYAVITGNADWCSWVCACFDSVDILCAVTVSLLANYHGKLMGQVTADFLKEFGDWTYAEDEARWHSPASLWRVTRNMTWLFASRKLGVSAERSCHVQLSWTSTSALHCKLEVSLWGLIFIREQWRKRWGKKASGRIHSSGDYQSCCGGCLKGNKACIWMDGWIDGLMGGLHTCIDELTNEHSIHVLRAMNK